MAVFDTDVPGERKSPFAGPRADLGHRAKATDTIIIGVAVIAALYLARDVLVPIALAVLLSFVLTPAVTALGHLRIGRAPSVLLAVVLAFAILGGLGAVIGKQAAELGENLPAYQTVITKKLDAIRSASFGRGLVEKAADALHGLDDKIGKPSPTAPNPSVKSTSTAETPAGQLVQVEVHQPAPGPVQIVQSILSALLPPLASASIVVIFVIFILLQRADLRDRFIGLIGSHDLHRTTKALDDGASRLSAYFLALTGINAAFGVAIAIGLSIIGVPNPMLWGVVGAVLRFIPYVGAFISAALPLALAAAVDPGWSMAIETALLFVVVEGVMGQVVEPQLFGHTTGMSPLAIIIAAAFWTLIWGAPGLILSTPITACLVVLGRHVESLNFIEILLGDKPPLSPVQSFYQRVLASDPDEVAFQAEALLKTMPLVQSYEEVALPALALAQVDIARGVLEPQRQAEVCDAVERITADLADHVDAEAHDKSGESVNSDSPSDPAAHPTGVVLCIAGRTPLDQAGCTILVQMLDREHIATQVAGPQALTTNGTSALDRSGVSAICIFYLDHGSLAPVRYFVRRLRKKFPSVPIAVCPWGGTDLGPIVDAAKADATVGTLREAIDFCAMAVRAPQNAELSTATLLTLPLVS